MKKLISVSALGTLVAIGLAGCTSQPNELPTFPTPSADVVPAAASLPSMWASEVDGTTESGSFYTLLLPKAWNGRLVIVVHGLIDPAAPVKPLARTPAEDSAGAHGYAIAYASYSENGWAVKDGAQRTHELRDLFVQAFGEPRRVYLYGQSMGGLISVDLAESFPTQLDGVVSECGVLGGTYSRFRYMIDTRLLFDYFYPNVLPGSALTMPAGLNVMTAVRLPARNAMFANMDGARKIAPHYWTQYYEPTGNLRIPVLSLYTDRDPALPAVLSDTVYSQRLLALGDRAMFRRQAASVQYGHCTGTVADRLTALRALVTWAEGQAAPW